MPLFEITEGQLRVVPATSFVDEEVSERADLQSWIRQHPGAIGEGLFIVADEFGQWEDARRRIDLLALDKDGNLVVIELKRTDDGGHMELQSIRYAAMVSAMRFEDVVAAHQKYLSRYEPGAVDQARTRLLTHLGYVPDTAEAVEIGSIPRIVLVSQDFSREITTTVLWLVDRGIDIRCIQAQPYKIADRLLIDFRQIIPLAQAVDYQVRLRQKEEEARQASTERSRRELTWAILVRHGLIQSGTKLELTPDARPSDGGDTDPRIHQATVGDPANRSVIWDSDGNSYTLSRLNQVLYDRGALIWVRDKSYAVWRRVGETRSLWDEAEELAGR